MCGNSPCASSATSKQQLMGSEIQVLWHVYCLEFSFILRLHAFEWPWSRRETQIHDPRLNRTHGLLGMYELVDSFNGARVYSFAFGTLSAASHMVRVNSQPRTCVQAAGPHKQWIYNIRIRIYHTILFLELLAAHSCYMACLPIGHVAHGPCTALT